MEKSLIDMKEFWMTPSPGGSALNLRSRGCSRLNTGTSGLDESPLPLTAIKTVGVLLELSTWKIYIQVIYTLDQFSFAAMRSQSPWGSC